MGKPDASRTLRFELNRLDLVDMTVKPHTIKIVGPAPTPDIAGLCERLRAEAAALRRWIADRADARTWGGPTMYPPHPITEDNAAPIIANATEAADTLERQADEIERLRAAQKVLRTSEWEFTGNERASKAFAALTRGDHD